MACAVLAQVQIPSPDTRSRLTVSRGNHNFHTHPRDSQCLHVELIVFDSEHTCQ